MRTTTRWAALAVTGALSLVACGGGDPSPSAASGVTSAPAAHASGAARQAATAASPPTPDGVEKEQGERRASPPAGPGCSPTVPARRLPAVVLDPAAIDRLRRALGGDGAGGVAELVATSPPSPRPASPPSATASPPAGPARVRRATLEAAVG